MNDVNLRKAEFEKYIWNHSADAFQVQFDDRRPLVPLEMRFLLEIKRLVASTADDDAAAEPLFRALGGDEARLSLLIQLCGLTRNKILQDLRASDPSLQVPSAFGTLVRRRSLWPAAGSYLASRARKTVCLLPNGAFEEAAEALNQATWPGFIRQERAKRMGHEAEYRLATLFSACEIAFEPQQKAENPLVPDAQINGISYDLVVPSIAEPKLCIKSTVHTANIGQFGESKDALEIKEALENLQRSFGDERPTLLAFIDGVGFRSNRAGLDDILLYCDEFCQFNTIWKAALVASCSTGTHIRLELPKEDRTFFASFIARYGPHAEIVSKEDNTSATMRFPAGSGAILIDG